LNLRNGYFASRIPALLLVVAASAGTLAQAAITMAISGPDSLESGEVCILSAVVAGTAPRPEIEWSVMEGTAMVDCLLDYDDGKVFFSPPLGDGIRRFTVQAKCGETVATHVILMKSSADPGQGGGGGTTATKRLRRLDSSESTSSLSLTSSSSSSSSFYSLPLLPALLPEGDAHSTLPHAAFPRPDLSAYLTNLPDTLIVYLGGFLSERDAYRLMNTAHHFRDNDIKRHMITDIRKRNHSPVEIDFSKSLMRDLFGYRNLSISQLTPSSMHKLNTAVDLTTLEFEAENHKLSNIYNLFFLPRLRHLTLTGEISAGVSLANEREDLGRARNRQAISRLDSLQLGESYTHGIDKSMNFDLSLIIDKLPLRTLHLGFCFIGQNNDRFRANLIKALPSLAKTLEDLIINTEGVFSEGFTEFTNALMTLNKLQELTIMNREGNNLTSEDFGRLGLALRDKPLEKLVFSFNEVPKNVDPAYLLNLPLTITNLESALICDVDHPEHIDTVITALGRLPILDYFSNEPNSHLTAHGAMRIANFLLNKESIESVEIHINPDGDEDREAIEEEITILKKAFQDADKKIIINFG
jgi:hypothetical protein